MLRDLKRKNANSPAYKILPELGFETFTPPMPQVLKSHPQGKQIRIYELFIHGLLFAKYVKSKLDEVVSKTEPLQYRFIKSAQQTSMTVPMKEVERFIKAVTYEHVDCTYYSPDEITSDMIGRRGSGS